MPVAVGVDFNIKRAHDNSASALLVAVFLPVLLMIVIAIRLHSPGKAIFAQLRV
jgi:lipopolysaccharide/colanic/teichoic acid biosynthesis glycosyltransferase